MKGSKGFNTILRQFSIFSEGKICRIIHPFIRGNQPFHGEEDGLDYICVPQIFWVVSKQYYKGGLATAVSSSSAPSSSSLPKFLGYLRTQNDDDRWVRVVEWSKRWFPWNIYSPLFWSRVYLRKIKGGFLLMTFSEYFWFINQSQHLKPSSSLSHNHKGSRQRN
jgi:hypothetical protein